MSAAALPSLIEPLHAFIGTPRFLPVEGDVMSPTLRRGDYVVVVPVDRYQGDGLYAFDLHGAPVIYRCMSNFKGGIAVIPDNKLYSTWDFTVKEFDDTVIGKIAATCKVLDPRLLANN
jgi:phage repressor protein C with HTH and peptisase S24 domain